MPATAARDAARRTERALGIVRVLVGLWAVGMAVSYPDYPEQYADIVRQVSLLTIGAFMASSIALWATIELRRSTSTARAAVIGLALDSVTVTGLAFAFGFDRTSAVWIILFLLPIEGAMRFQLRGAALAFSFAAGGYVAREYAWSVWVDNPADVRSIVFRMVVVAIVTAFVGLISEQLRQEREVATAALRRVEKSDRWRARLVSALGHDLRSPLANVEMQALAVRDPRLSEDQRELMLDSIVRHARRLTRLAEGLLDLAAADHASLELWRGTVDVSAVVHDAVDLLGLYPSTTIEVEEGLVVEGDEDRLSQVVLNLISNARKHGAPPIEIRAVLDGDTLVLSVRDHGPGIPDELRSSIFDEFTAHGRMAGSVGLGLSLVRTIVEAHGGGVILEAADPGARFEIRIPGARVDLDRAVDVSTATVDADAAG